MKLLVLLIVLGLRQTALGREPAQAAGRLLRRWRDGWMMRGARENWGGAVILALIVLPPVLALLALVLALEGRFYSLLYTGLSLVVMLVLLLDREHPGVQQREQAAWQEADEQEPGVLAQAELPVLEAAALAEFGRARQALLAEQLRDLFAPLLWFVVLGPVAALAYYLLRLCAVSGPAEAGTAEPASASLAARLLHFADWPVARVLALSFALAGNFVTTWQHWRQYALDTEKPAVALLDESADAAQPAELRLSHDTLPGPQLVTALAAVAALLHRALVIWIVLLALHTLWP